MQTKTQIQQIEMAVLRKLKAPGHRRAADLQAIAITFEAFEAFEAIQHLPRMPWSIAKGDVAGDALGDADGWDFDDEFILSFLMLLAVYQNKQTRRDK